MSWLNKGVDLELERRHIPPPDIPLRDVLYADDAILLGTLETVIQTRFTILEFLASAIGLEFNRCKTVTFLARVKGKQTLGTALQGYSYLIRPARILYSDGVEVQTSESEDFLGARLTRSLAAKVDLKHRLSLCYKRITDLKALWHDTGISRRRELDLMESLVASKILHSLETLNLTDREFELLTQAQFTCFKRALGLAPPNIACHDSLRRRRPEDNEVNNNYLRGYLHHI